MDNAKSQDEVTSNAPAPFAQTYFHGTKADLKLGDLIKPGFPSNFVNRNLKHVYVSATLAAAIWGAEFAAGDGRERIYLVEATDAVEDDPNLTNKKFPGNPSMSYRSAEPFKVVGEVTLWQGHSAEEIKAVKDGLARLAEQGKDLIEE